MFSKQEWGGNVGNEKGTSAYYISLSAYFGTLIFIENLMSICGAGGSVAFEVVKCI